MRRARKPINQINVVPYIDVMLVLLIIFMVTAPLVAPGEIQLPSVGSRLTNPDNPLNVRLEGKTITLSDKLSNTSHRVSKDQLVADVLAAQATGDRPVVIAADKDARYQDVLDILDVLQRNGVKRVGLLARPPGV
ncbi:MAG TPA: biopolymer transporter ExbD [Casimicrobiaceae bacterium]|jgi:biopolymer transport protein TolR|nr:biopolymer transporter ExbD [Casimicrobiaceae bacterium]